MSEQNPELVRLAQGLTAERFRPKPTGPTEAEAIRSAKRAMKAHDYAAAVAELVRAVEALSRGKDRP